MQPETAPAVAMVVGAPDDRPGVHVDEETGTLAILAAGRGLSIGPLRPCELRDLAELLRQVARGLERRMAH
jgi:hypothetical protein